jgi:hypothetical protein
MSFELSIDQELGAVVIRAIGVIGLDDVQAAVTEIVALPGFVVGMNQILDLTEGGVELDGAEPERLATFFQSGEVRAQLGSGYRLAVVAPQPSDLGVSRMFQAYDLHDKVTILVIHGLDEARAWLGESQT